MISDKEFRQAQLVQLEILSELDKFCKNYNISYNLVFGTLLGAVRHKGFIPWDDDIDVGMLRKDFDYFNSMFPLDYDGYFLQNYNTDAHYYRQFSRLRKNNTTYLQNGYQDLGIHHGIFIDIFPLDDVSPSKVSEIFRCELILLLEKINRLRNYKVTKDRNLFIRIISKIAKLSTLIINKEKYDKLITYLLKGNKKSIYVSSLSNWPDRKKVKRNLIKKEDFLNSIQIDFESHQFPAPRKYHQYLTNIYGDYKKLPPIEKRQPHHGVIKIEL
jgi:lipopolysaccharide cholinephosphotransferase